MSSIAHDLTAKPRTEDVLIQEQLNFNTLLLSEATLLGLQRAGFQKPSPIQLKAIPIGKCGFDLMIESKSGTGKTAVFAIIALELLKLAHAVPQVLILAPTREIAVQICDVLRTLGVGYKGLKVESFIGGFPIEEDTKKLPGCQVIVGAPGRIKHLIKMGILSLSAIKLFVLDEVDKLLEESFQHDVYEIFKNLPRVKQIITLSATYTDELKRNLETLMYSPSFITPSTGSPLLLGLKQFVSVVKCNLNVIHQVNIKNEELERLLQKVSFSQCIIFSNYQTRAESISNTLNRKGWNTMYISGAQTQGQRLEAINSLKRFKCRILLSTDVSARGIDASNVDLIINYDVPNDASTYLHRMGRAGRYGSYGACVTLAADGKELSKFQVLLGNIGGSGLSVPKLPNDDIPADLLNCDLSKFEAVLGIVDVAKKSDTKLDISKSVMGIKNSKYEHNTEQGVPLIDEKEKKANKSSFDVNLDNIHEFLDMKIQNEKNVESQVANLEPFDLLDSLASGKQINIQDSVTLTDVITENVIAEMSDNQLHVACDSKKRKRGDHVDTNNLKLKAAPETVSNNDNKIFLKNVALLNATKLLVNDFYTSDIEHEIVESISAYLNILKNDNQSLVDYFRNKSSDEILSQLSQGVPYTLNIPDLKNEDVCKENQITEQDKLENIFQLGFDYAVKPNVAHWLDVLGEDFQEKVDLSKDELDFIEVQKPYSYSEGESSELRSHKRKNKHKRHHKKKKRNTYHKDVASNSECDLEGSKNFLQWYNKTHKENLNQLNYNYECYPGLYSEYEYSNNEHFTKCFEHYNNELTERVEAFDDTVSFTEWFSQWQYHVQGVRDYIQQNIYIQEMNRYALNQN